MADEERQMGDLVWLSDEAWAAIEPHPTGLVVLTIDG